MKLQYLAVIIFSAAWTAGANAREWTDASGKYRTEAELLWAEKDEVWLRKPDGKTVLVQVNRLSEADKAYIAEQIAGREPLEAESAVDTEPQPPQPVAGQFAAVMAGGAQLLASVPVASTNPGARVLLAHAAAARQPQELIPPPQADEQAPQQQPQGEQVEVLAQYQPPEKKYVYRGRKGTFHAFGYEWWLGFGTGHYSIDKHNYLGLLHQTATDFFDSINPADHYLYYSDEWGHPDINRWALWKPSARYCGYRVYYQTNDGKWHWYEHENRTAPH